MAFTKLAKLTKLSCLILLLINVSTQSNIGLNSFNNEGIKLEADQVVSIEYSQNTLKTTFVTNLKKYFINLKSEQIYIIDNLVVKDSKGNYLQNYSKRDLYKRRGFSDPDLIFETEGINTDLETVITVQFEANLYKPFKYSIFLSSNFYMDGNKSEMYKKFKLFYFNFDSTAKSDNIFSIKSFRPDPEVIVIVNLNGYNKSFELCTNEQIKEENQVYKKECLNKKTESNNYLFLNNQDCDFDYSAYTIESTSVENLDIDYIENKLYNLNIYKSTAFKNNFIIEKPSDHNFLVFRNFKGSKTLPVEKDESYILNFKLDTNFSSLNIEQEDVEYVSSIKIPSNNKPKIVVLKANQFSLLNNNLNLFSSNLLDVKLTTSYGQVPIVNDSVVIGSTNQINSLKEQLAYTINIIPSLIISKKPIILSFFNSSDKELVFDFSLKIGGNNIQGSNLKYIKQSILNYSFKRESSQILILKNTSSNSVSYAAYLDKSLGEIEATFEIIKSGQISSYNMKTLENFKYAESFNGSYAHIDLDVEEFVKIQIKSSSVIQDNTKIKFGSLIISSYMPFSDSTPTSHDINKLAIMKLSPNENYYIDLLKLAKDSDYKFTLQKLDSNNSSTEITFLNTKEKIVLNKTDNKSISIRKNTNKLLLSVQNEEVTIVIKTELELNAIKVNSGTNRVELDSINSFTYLLYDSVEGLEKISLDLKSYYYSNVGEISYIFLNPGITEQEKSGKLFYPVTNFNLFSPTTNVASDETSFTLISPFERVLLLLKVGYFQKEGGFGKYYDIDIGTIKTVSKTINEESTAVQLNVEDRLYLGIDLSKIKSELNYYAFSLVVKQDWKLKTTFCSLNSQKYIINSKFLNTMEYNYLSLIVEEKNALSLSIDCTQNSNLPVLVNANKVDESFKNSKLNLQSNPFTINLIKTDLNTGESTYKVENFEKFLSNSTTAKVDYYISISKEKDKYEGQNLNTFFNNVVLSKFSDYLKLNSNYEFVVKNYVFKTNVLSFLNLLCYDNTSKLAAVYKTLKFISSNESILNDQISNLKFLK